MKDEHVFELETLRIARLLWPAAQYSGSEMIDGRERDGVFETEECHHYVESTVSRGQQKAFDDCKKLAELIKKKFMSNDGKGARGWFITLDEPTADQRKVLEDPKLIQYKSHIKILSFQQFQSKIIDARDYLDLRSRHFFGSVRDPETSGYLPKVDYVEMDYFERDTTEIHSIYEVCEKIRNGVRVVLTGDYGSGKSMTLRQIFQILKNDYVTGKSAKFPIAINLREHLGSDDPSDILAKHGKNIGFPNPDHLVRAWKLGYVYLLLDGYDEISTYGIHGSWKKLKDIRFKSLLPIRKFSENSDNNSIVISGRYNYISDREELLRGLGLRNDTLFLVLNEFNDDQLLKYLERYSIRTALPGWIPNKPLFLGHLAARGTLRDLVNPDTNHILNDAAEGWNFLIGVICEREAKINGNIDGETVRLIIERLATIARKYTGGLGPLTKDLIEKVYEEICQFPFDDKAIVMIQRFPGLGIHSNEDETRSFVDENFADICRSGDMIRLILDPFGNAGLFPENVECPLSRVGIERLSKWANANDVTGKKLCAAINSSALANRQTLKLDLVRVIDDLNLDIPEPVHLRELIIEDLDLSSIECDLSRATFSDCMLERVQLPASDFDTKLPAFHNCFFDLVEGRTNALDLPRARFNESCEFVRFGSDNRTNSGIKSQNISVQEKVLLVILKKLFVQSLSGRKEKALFAGMTTEETRYVKKIISILERNGFIIPYRKNDYMVWIPVRTHLKDAYEILSNPHGSSVSAIVETREL